ncbi:unnamed protein product [Polarella glacialis]|nr:unnamed protein product [Polarella glacialis]
MQPGKAWPWDPRDRAAKLRWEAVEDLELHCFEPRLSWQFPRQLRFLGRWLSSIKSLLRPGSEAASTEAEPKIDPKQLGSGQWRRQATDPFLLAEQLACLPSAGGPVAVAHLLFFEEAQSHELQQRREVPSVLSVPHLLFFEEAQNHELQQHMEVPSVLSVLARSVRTAGGSVRYSADLKSYGAAGQSSAANAVVISSWDTPGRLLQFLRARQACTESASPTSPVPTEPHIEHLLVCSQPLGLT